MTDQIVPAAVQLAAKRGFVRTTTQAYTATLAAGLPSATAIVALIQDPTGWLLAGITVGLAVLSPPVAGLVSYLSITSDGIPKAYADATLVQQSVLAPSEAESDQQAATARVLLRRDLKG